MKSLHLAIVIALSAVACIRANPLYSGPSYEFRDKSKDGKLNKPNDGTLDPQGNDAYAQGFRVELPAPGALIVTAKPGNPAAQLDLDLYGDGKVPLGSTEKQNDKKLTVQDLQPGIYYVVVRTPWRGGEATTFKVTPVFKPADPDAEGACKSQGTAKELAATGSAVEGTVDYSAQKRTCFYKIPMRSGGALTVKFNPNGSNLSAELIPPQGAPEKIDPAAGLSKADAASGDYYVKVYANEAGDAGRYTLVASATDEGPCGKNAKPSCTVEGAEELKTPSDSKAGDVNYAQGNGFHFYKLNVKEKGKLTVGFKITQPQRGSKVAAYLMRTPDDEGERLIGASSTREVEGPGDVFIRVQASDPGEYGKYAITTIFQPNNVISGDVVEWGKSPCMLTVMAGTDQSVRAGAACTIVNQSGQAVDTCVVDQVFPHLSKVKPMNAACRQIQNAKVQISAQ